MERLRMGVVVNVEAREKRWFVSRGKRVGSICQGTDVMNEETEMK